MKNDKIILQLREKYNTNIGYMERVMRSCTTPEQLDLAYKWAKDILRRYWENEVDTPSLMYRFLLMRYFDVIDSIEDYFDLKNRIIDHTFYETSLKLEK